MCVCVYNHSLYNSGKIHMDSMKRPLVVLTGSTHWQLPTTLDFRISRK